MSTTELFRTTAERVKQFASTGEPLPSFILMSAATLFKDPQTSRFCFELYNFFRWIDDIVDENAHTYDEKVNYLNIARRMIRVGYEEEIQNEYPYSNWFLSSQHFTPYIRDLCLMGLTGMEREIATFRGYGQPSEVRIEDLRARGIIPYLMIASDVLLGNKILTRTTGFKTMVRLCRLLSESGDLRDYHEDFALGKLRFSVDEAPENGLTAGCINAKRFQVFQKAYSEFRQMSDLPNLTPLQKSLFSFACVVKIAIGTDKFTKAITHGLNPSEVTR